MMRDPVVWVDGMSYEREAIEMWLTKSDMSPVIQKSFPGQKTLLPNFTLRSFIKEWKERTGYSESRAGGGVVLLNFIGSGMEDGGETG